MSSQASLSNSASPLSSTSPDDSFSSSSSSSSAGSSSTSLGQENDLEPKPSSQKPRPPTTREVLSTIKPIEDFKNLPNIPCARYSLLVGIVAGVSVGSLKFIFSKGAAQGGRMRFAEMGRAANWAVGTWGVASLGSWETCRRRQTVESARMQNLIFEAQRRRELRKHSSSSPVTPAPAPISSSSSSSSSLSSPSSSSSASSSSYTSKVDSTPSTDYSIPGGVIIGGKGKQKELDRENRRLEMTQKQQDIAQARQDALDRESSSSTSTLSSSSSTTSVETLSSSSSSLPSSSTSSTPSSSSKWWDIRHFWTSGDHPKKPPKKPPQDRRDLPRRNEDELGVKSSDIKNQEKNETATPPSLPSREKRWV